MKKFYYYMLLLSAVSSVVAFAVEHTVKEKSNNNCLIEKNGDKNNSITEITTFKPQIPVGEKNFKKIVAYIEKNGFLVPQRGIPCDHQYTFIDKNGNRHALITTRRDKNGEPSVKGSVESIDVWAYYKGKKDLEHFFGYSISKEKVALCITDPEYIEKHIYAVKKGYEDFLAHVNK